MGLDWRAQSGLTFMRAPRQMDLVPIRVILGAYDVGRVHGTVSYLDIRMLRFAKTPSYGCLPSSSLLLAGALQLHYRFVLDAV